MQLIIITIAFFFFVCTQKIKAQVQNQSDSNHSSDDSKEKLEVLSTEYTKPDWKKIEIDFLSSYYVQEGNNAAVTGGVGTEALSDFTQKILAKIPLKPNLTLNVNGGYDYYSSESTDNIDNIKSSDSSSDMRAHASIGMTYHSSKNHQAGFNIGGSVEYDYVSLHGGINYTLFTPDKNTSISLSAQAFIDRWELIYPREIRREVRAPTDHRNSFNLALGVSRVLNKRMQFSLNIEGTYMDGLLSTPFHRVYFQGQDLATIESLPSKRLKIPLGARLHWHVSEKVITRMFYRYYWDDWGIKGHTVGVEIPFKINRFFSVYPHYRFHTQTSANYFLPYKEHSLNSEYYTSDYDLSDLSSHHFGMGLQLSPLNGIAKIKKPFSDAHIVIKYIDIKYSHYERSTGLNANIISLGIGITY